MIDGFQAMAIRVALNHRTTCQYDRVANLGAQVVRLRPAPHCRTPVTGCSLRIEPKLHFRNWQQDPQANWQARLTFPVRDLHRQALFAGFNLRPPWPR